MASKFKFLFLYFLTWVLFFDLMRLVFLIYHADKTKHLSFHTIISAFWYGLRMDISVAAYILIPVCVLVLLSLFFRFFGKVTVYKIYTFIVLLLVTLISLADLEIYNTWGFRIDAEPFKFLKTPREAFASVSHLPLFLILVVFVISYGLLCLCFKYILRKIIFQQQNSFKAGVFFLIAVFTACLIIPIRGGFQLTPLNQSSVYFSTNNYANHAAINPSWNLLHSFLNKDNLTVNPYQYLPENRARSLVDSLYTQDSTTGLVINSSSGRPVNVILIVWESFTEKAIHISINGEPVTPGFNKLKQEGIYFSNAYASGDRTNKGLPAILSGYPAMPKNTIINSPGKSLRLEVLSKLFKEKGYQTPFFYGGEPDFANIKSYLLQGGFDPIVGKRDFASKDMNSKWGAHDGVVMNRVLEDLNKTKNPFFAAWLTLTSHEPFETPVAATFKGNSIETRFLNSLHYTDQVVYDFIEKCSKEPWWANTVLIITGDHGHPLPRTGNKADEFRIPMLWLGGALNKKGVVIERVVSQLDIATTISHQLGLNTGHFPFSKNLFSDFASSWAFFTFNDGFGFVDSAGRVVFDNVGKQPVTSEGRVSNKETEAGKAMMQMVYDDYLKK